MADTLAVPELKDYNQVSGVQESEGLGAGLYSTFVEHLIPFLLLEFFSFPLGPAALMCCLLLIVQCQRVTRPDLEKL